MGFAVHNRLLKKISTPRGVSKRISILELATKTGKAHIISAYSPTLTSESEKKDLFYEQLQDVINSIPKADQIFLMHG